MRCKKPVYLYHAMPFEQVRRGLIVPDKRFSDEENMPAYEWLEKEVGFFPIFMAIGDEEAVYVTGYQNQWRRYLGGSYDPVTKVLTNRYRKAGESPNSVLFAFELEDVPVRSYHDYMWWHIVLSDTTSGRSIGPQSRSWLFKKSWNEARWLRLARRDGHLVEVVTPSLDLNAASFIWVRNDATRRALLAQGFANVQVKRLRLDND